MIRALAVAIVAVMGLLILIADIERVEAAANDRAREHAAYVARGG